MHLSTYLLKNNIETADFAKEIDTSFVTVWRYLKGQRTPTHEIMQRILHVTNGQVQPQDFYDLPPPTSLPAEHQPHA